MVWADADRQLKQELASSLKKLANQKENMSKVKQEIEKIVKKYSEKEYAGFNDNEKDLFRLELELLVLEAEREQMKKDHEETLRFIK